MTANTPPIQMIAPIVEALPAPLLLVDERHTIQAVSQLYLSQVHNGDPPIPGQTRLEELPFWDDPAYRQFVTTLDAAFTEPIRINIDSPDGHLIHLTATPIPPANTDDARFALIQFGFRAQQVGMMASSMFMQARMTFYVYDVKADLFLVRTPSFHPDGLEVPGPYSTSPERFLAAVHEEDRAHVRDMLARLHEGLSSSMEYRIWIDGDLYHCQTHTYVTIENGELLHMAGIIQDITAERQAQESLLRRTEERLQAEREQAVLRAKSNFLTLISHEFRTPLAVIQSSSELLRKYLERMDEEKKERHFERIEIQVQRLTSMLNEILLIGRIGTERFENNARRIFIEQFTRDVVRSVQNSTGAQHSIAIETRGVAQPLIVDRDYMEHALAHIIKNALVYTPPGSHIEIHIHAHPDEVTLVIRDNGPGVLPGDMPHLFEFFYRGGNALNIPGNGLGLGFARQVIDLHRGSLTIESAPDAGTTVTVTLPVHSDLPHHLSE